MKKDINFYKNELADSYEQNIDREIDAAIAEAEANPHVFSERFEKIMEELIRTGKPDKPRGEDYSYSVTKKKKISKKGLRVLLIAAAIIIALTAVACAVPEIRESIAGFFVRIFSDHAEYSNPDITKESIEEEYGLVPMPEGFSIVEKSISNSDLIVIYADENGTLLSFVQSINSDLSHSVDSEQGEFIEQIINGNLVRIYYSTTSVQASWVEDGYYFSLSYPSKINLDSFDELVGLVNKQ